MSPFAADGRQEGDITSSLYMGGPAELVTAPNGAITNAEALKKLPEIMYLKPTTEKVAEGVWCIGGYSVANTTVIEAEDGLIVYDTGDNDEEAEHIRAAIEKISDKPIKVIMYSHSHYALGGGKLVDNPEDVMVIGHPTVNDTVQANLQGGGAPSVYGEIGPVLTARAVVQMNNFLPEEGPDARLGGVIPIGKQISPLPATVTPEHGAKANKDGSYDVYFGPKLPDGVPEENWVQTKAGKGWFVYLWLYGPEKPYFDKKWIPGDAEKIK
jgi:hypothetical protein